MSNFDGMFKLISTTPGQDGAKDKRIYRNDETSTEIVMTKLYKDGQGHTWWGFDDLLTLPFIRQMAAKRVIELYGNGLSIDDIKQYTAQLKVYLKNHQDPERYEKAYAKVLEIEQLTDMTADPVRQSLGLCTVYLLIDDERPDIYNQQTQNLKMSSLAMDIDAQAFFLRWWTDSIQRYGNLLKGLSAIASMTSQ